jgi:hypothetical protein
MYLSRRDNKTAQGIVDSGESGDCRSRAAVDRPLRDGHTKGQTRDLVSIGPPSKRSARTAGRHGLMTDSTFRS